MNNDGISIIVPFLNEGDALPIFCKTIDEYAGSLKFSVELVFVDDGSTDNSIDFLRNYIFKNINSAKIICLSKNFGFHSAVRAGIESVKFDICTWFGADLQEPLEIINIAYDKLSKGDIEVVYFSKRSIKISRLSRVISLMYSSLMKKYAISTYSSEGTATVAFGSKVKKILNDNPEANSQVVLQIMNMGFRYENISLDYYARSAGESKWTLSKKIKTFIDSFVAFSYMPIRLVSVIGLVIFFIGLIIGVVTIVNKFVNPDVQAGYSTIASFLALGFGITNISLGIISEYLWRTLDVARKRPVYIVSDTINLIKADKDDRYEKEDISNV